MFPKTETKPWPPVQIWILCAVLVLGLIAQYIGGEAAFALLERGPLYSAAASALIEAMAMAEAFTLAMSYRTRADDERDEGRLTFNPFALAGLVVSLGCSGIYNFVWVKEAVPGLEPYQVAAYAVGPLAALSSAGLTLGTELREYLVSLTDWTEVQEHQVQAQAVAELDRQAELEKQEREWKRRIEFEKTQAEIARQARLVELEAEEQRRAARVRERDERKRVKMEAELRTQEVRQAEPVGNFLTGKAEGKKAELGSARKTLDFHLENPEATQAEMAAALGITDRSVRNHLQKAREKGLLDNGRH